jgi:hypothetical protein
LIFSGSKDEWPTWTKKFLAKAKRSRIKDLLLGRFSFPNPLKCLMSALSLGKKTERFFRESKLGKDEDPETRITNLEDLRLKVEVMGLYLT